MNPFKVGDIVQVIECSPGYTVTCIEGDKIGFVSKYPIDGDLPKEVDDKAYKDMREGKKAWCPCAAFELAQSAEDIDFEKRKKEILDESV